MKVWIVYEDWHNDWGDSGDSIRIFENRDKAYQYYNDCRIDNVDFIEESDSKVVDDHDPDIFEVYEAGDWFYNHYIVRLEEKEVE
jgi:hypothetical protein